MTDPGHRSATAVAPAGKGLRPGRVAIIAAAALLSGALGGGAIATEVVHLFDDSRPALTIADVLGGRPPGFAATDMPSRDACGDRLGCVEGVVGDGIAIYRYRTLDLAREAVVYDDTDLHRSDRLIVEFRDTFDPEERYRARQHIEGLWTTSSD